MLHNGWVQFITGQSLINIHFRNAIESILISLRCRFVFRNIVSIRRYHISTSDRAEAATRLESHWEIRFTRILLLSKRALISIRPHGYPNLTCVSVQGPMLRTWYVVLERRMGQSDRAGFWAPFKKMLADQVSAWIFFPSSSFHSYQLLFTDHICTDIQRSQCSGVPSTQRLLLGSEHRASTNLLCRDHEAKLLCVAFRPDV